MTIEPNGYKILKNENEQLEKEVNGLKEESNFWFEKAQTQQEQKFKIMEENTKLQNDLFSEQLEQDETEEYINRLKQELFNLYLKHY